ncbi:Rv3235 family protein [Tsukamurella sp. 1534]|uniref:Rv3235 family protein n=1 Tax=Tsukamurella sp. 1534 TaxID=1151061 RepID=UPI0006ACDB64|nr:Rv3235 family protein [Tsukamurella sp. 1534]
MGATNIAPQAHNGFTILRAPCAEPATRPLARDRQAWSAPPVPVIAPPPDGAPSDPRDLPGPITAVHPDAHRFVLSTLRPVFEVLDRRRPAKHLTAICTSTVVDVLRALADAGPPATVTTWGRVHVAAPRALPARQRPRRGDPQVAAEIFLTYSRGDRVLAAAGRVESTAGGWRWVAFTTAA